MGFFSSFFGGSELDSLDARIDNIINNLPGTNRTTHIENISGEFINEFIKDAPSGEIDSLFRSISVSRQRLERYNVYDEAYKYVPIIKRILAVYIANILQKNPVTGKCLLVREAHDTTGDRTVDESTLNKAKKLAEECIKSFDLTLKLRKKILPNELVYGDCYVEVVSLVQEGKKKVDPNISFSNITSMTPLFEAELSNIEKQIHQLKIRKDTNGTNISYSQIDGFLSKINEYFVEVQQFPEQEIQDEAPKSRSSNQAATDGDVIKFDDILLKIHKPHRVIVLETDFGSLLGYLIVTKNETPQTLNLTQSLSTLVGRITTLTGLDQKSENFIVDRLVRYILKTVLEKSQKLGKIGQSTSIDDLLSGLSADVYQYLKRLFVEQDLVSKSTTYNQLKVRFVPSSDMIAFSIPSAEHDPYGQSFIDALVFPCKLYILSQLSNIIIKLSRASPVRKWSIDVGQTQMHAGLIQKLKRELYNTRITLDDLNSFESIPKILSDFKDMFILSKGGQKAIDVEVSSHGDPTVRVSDLEDARREIMSLSGIPPAYLGYADVIELREQLVHTNIAFATEISDIQEGISQGLTKLLDIIARMKGLDYVPSEYVSIQLIPPIVLMIQLIEMTLSSIGNMVSAFQAMQIPYDPYFLLEKYLPYINWDAFKKRAVLYRTDVETANDLKASNSPSGGVPGG